MYGQVRVIRLVPASGHRLAGFIFSSLKGTRMPYQTPTRLRKSAYNAQRGQCCYCGKPMWLEDVEAFAKAHNYSLRQANLLKCTAEHLHARTDGGDDSPENVAAACWYCNSKRHKRTQALSPEQYRKHVITRMQIGRWHRLGG
jgi:5-methylcytosine-specific restriction endonuclease McrA